jgi:glutamyl-tRNA reductase
MRLDNLSEHLSVYYAAGASVVSVTGTSSTRRRPLVVCDLGLPRNVDPAVGDVPGVTLLDLTTVARWLEQRGTGSGAVVSARHLVVQEMRNYLLAQRTAEVIPTVAALRKRAADVVDGELLRRDGRLPGLDPAVRTELTRTVRRVVDKLLHVPTVQVKQLPHLAKWEAGEPDDTDWLQPWFDTMRAATQAGKAFRRARIVSEPISDYQKWVLRGLSSAC